MVVTLGQQYNTGEKHTVVMLLVIGKEKIFTLYNESTEIFYDVYSETVVSKTKYSTQFTQLVFREPAGKTTLHCRQVSFIESSSSSSPLYCLRENVSFDTLIRRSSRGHNSRKATQPSHCGTCLILLIFIAKRVQPSLPSSTLRSNFVYPRQISRSPRVGHCMS